MKKVKFKNSFNPIIISLNSEKQLNKDPNFQKEFALNGVNEEFL